MNTLLKPTVYIWINKGLGMSAGKIASQAAHATAQAFAQLPHEDLQTFWRDEPHRTIIVFEARDETHLRNIREYLGERGVATDMIVDEGANEVPKHSITALCTGILDKHERTDKLMSTFDLYREPETVSTGNLIKMLQGFGNEPIIF